MGLPRCSLTVVAAEAAVYRELVEQVQAHSASASYIMAAPDCPEIYFLSERRNPSPIMYEFFRPAWFGNPDVLLDELDRHNVNVFVANRFPAFPDRIPPSLMARLSERFPSSRPIYLRASDSTARVERFRVFWRE
jgi:hypothetical protein